MTHRSGKPRRGLRVPKTPEDRGGLSLRLHQGTSVGTGRPWPAKSRGGSAEPPGALPRGAHLTPGGTKKPPTANGLSVPERGGTLCLGSPWPVHCITDRSSRICSVKNEQSSPVSRGPSRALPWAAARWGERRRLPFCRRKPSGCFSFLLLPEKQHLFEEGS